VSAGDIAAMVYEQSAKGKHIIIPTFRETMLWRIKRYMPAFYFVFMKKWIHKIINK
jgi:hypothetical protein